MKIKIKNSPEGYVYLTHEELMSYRPDCYERQTDECLFTVVYEVHRQDMSYILFADLNSRKLLLAYKDSRSVKYTLRQIPIRGLSIVEDIVNLGSMMIVVSGFIDFTHLPSSKVGVFNVTPA